MKNEYVEITYEDFPEKIKNIRNSKKITQAVLAEKANVTQQTISALERGKLDPSLKLLLAIAGVLGVALILNAIFSKGGEEK